MENLYYFYNFAVAKWEVKKNLKIKTNAVTNILVCKSLLYMLNYSIELIPVSKVTESKLCIFLRSVICIFKLSSRKAVQDFSHQQWVTIIFQISKMYQMISKIVSSSYLHQNLTDIPQTSLHVPFRIYHFPDH